MKHKIEETRTTSVSMTNDGATEQSYMIVQSTKNRDTVLAMCPNRESADKTFVTLRHDLRKSMSAKKRPVEATLLMRKIRKHGVQVDKNEDTVKIRWDTENISTERVSDITKYSGNYARRMTKKV